MCCATALSGTTGRPVTPALACGHEDLLELRPGPGATASHPLATIEWARQWPCEEVWKARKTGRARAHRDDE